MQREFRLGNYILLWVFGVAFGYLEAAVVIYLRRILNAGSDVLFPVQAALSAPENLIVAVEVNRELATLVLLLIPAVLFTQRNFLRFLAYAVVFGIWDLAYYGFLWLLVGWPPGWMTYDVLFLVPTLWVAPVLCPALLAGTMVLMGSWLLFQTEKRPIRPPSATHWVVALAGAGVVLFSFMGEAEYYRGGGLPPRFAWDFFVGGYGLALLAGLHYLFTVARTRTRFA